MATGSYLSVITLNVNAEQLGLGERSLPSRGAHGQAVVTAHKTLVISISGETPLNIEQQPDDLLAVLEEEILCFRKRNKTVRFKFFPFFSFSFFLPVKTSNQAS